MRVCLFDCICASACACIYVCVHTYMCLCVHAYICVSVCMRISVSLHAFMYLCVCIYVCLCVHAYTCVSLYLCICVCMHTCVSVCMRMCVCVCVYICVRMHTHVCLCVCCYAGVLGFSWSTWNLPVYPWGGPGTRGSGPPREPERRVVGRGGVWIRFHSRGPGSTGLKRSWLPIWGDGSWWRDAEPGLHSHFGVTFPSSSLWFLGG